MEGLRAVAVLAVLVYHGSASWLQGGFLGVDVFFVISGFLITSLLLAEYEQSGTLDLKQFWLRRAKRLLPALYVLLIVCMTYALFFLPDQVARLRGDTLASLGYVTNWYLVFGHQSYFQAVGRPSLFQHLWSLAVEEQFYILWPLALVALLPRVRRLVPLALLGAALASTLAMALLYRPSQDPSPLYYGTGTRCPGLLVGAVLAFVWTPFRRGHVQPGRTVRVVDAVGAVGALGLLLCFWTLGEQQPLLFRGGFLIASLCTVLMIVAAAHPQARGLARLLALPPLRWLGARSYGIYLWHWPVMAVTRPHLDVPIGGPPLVLLQVGASIGLATLSYTFVETPVRSGALGHLWRVWRAAGGRPRTRLDALAASTAAAGLVGLLVLSAMVALARPPAPPSYLRITSIHGTLGAPSPDEHPERKPAPAPSPRPTAAPLVPSGCPPPPAPTKVSAIGDSVMLGAAPALAAAIPGIDMDATEGRQAQATIDVLHQKLAAGTLGPTVVVHLGNNGFVTDDQMRDLTSTLRCEHRVVLINDKVPTAWQDANDAILQHWARQSQNIAFVDWRAASAPHPEWFYDDGIHLRPPGAAAYAQLITQAIDSA